MTAEVQHMEEGATKREVVEIGTLKPHPKNYRRHPEDQLAHIMRSIEEHGIYRNVVTARDGTILAGHGVVLALQKLGRTQVPIIRLPLDPDEPKAIKVLAGDNEISKLGEVDDRALSELLKGVNDLDDLLGTGFDEMMLANLVFVTRPASEVPDFDAAAAWADAGLPEYERVGKKPQLVVNFDTVEEREKFYKLIHEPIIHKKMGDDRLWSTWWPSRPRNDAHTQRFEDSSKADAPAGAEASAEDGS